MVLNVSLFVFGFYKLEWRYLITAAYKLPVVLCDVRVVFLRYMGVKVILRKEGCHFLISPFNKSLKLILAPSFRCNRTDPAHLLALKELLVQL